MNEVKFKKVTVRVTEESFNLIQQVAEHSGEDVGDYMGTIVDDMARDIYKHWRACLEAGDYCDHSADLPNLLD